MVLLTTHYSPAYKRYVVSGVLISKLCFLCDFRSADLTVVHLLKSIIPCGASQGVFAKNNRDPFRTKNLLRQSYYVFIRRGGDYIQVRYDTNVKDKIYVVSSSRAQKTTAMLLLTRSHIDCFVRYPSNSELDASYAIPVVGSMNGGRVSLPVIFII